ncbi:HpcH/HpaI aldolase/citrate lyase family protein [Oceanibium sediminis]|uniref:HpcH/HpaI aldolase/citrate lyase family protein n=1 Tax=Oceanibium sediminis TaxID=2026339 RepID=UPI0013003726|nr:CoA ester lyase [Oceanibium sediminis]
MPFRSLLFTPATRLDQLPKALVAGADWVALDLEDGVGSGGKVTARAAMRAFAGDGMGAVAGQVAVRINTLSSADGIRDMAAMLDWPVWPGMVILPKVSAPSEVAQLVALAAGCGQAPVIMAVLETAAGIACADRIACALPKTGALGYGSVDHTAETGGEMSDPALAWARGQIVNAAAIAGIPAMDGVWLDFRDPVGLEAEARMVKSMGFAGKIAIHPDQIGPINAVFSPAAEELEVARAMLAAADAAGGGAFSYKGKMVDAPVLARARRIVGGVPE